MQPPDAGYSSIPLLNRWRAASPDHGSDNPGSLSERRHGLIHQGVSLDEVEHLVRERVGGVKPGALNGAATGSGGESVGVRGWGVTRPRWNGDKDETYKNNPPRFGDDFIGDGRPNGLGRLLLLEPAVEHGGQLLHVEGADGRARDAAETQARGLRFNLLRLVCFCAKLNNGEERTWISARREKK